MKQLISRWLLWRHGDVRSIKPPIGWSKYRRVTMSYKVAYWCKWSVWKIESRLHDWSNNREAGR